MQTLGPLDPATNYADVLDALPIIAYMANPDGVITYVSAGWERFTGTSASEVTEHGYATVIFPDDLEAVVATWNASRKEERRYRDTFRVRVSDGSFRWVVSQADTVRRFDGVIVGWFGTLTDIHQEREAEDAMERAVAASALHAYDAETRAEFIESLFAASDDCITVLDLDARLISMSTNGQKALAITDFVSVAGANWLADWNGDDRLAAESAVVAARSGGRGRFTGFYAVEGHEKWWDVTVTPILGADRLPERLLAVSRDVTEMLVAHRELERGEERHRTLSEALPGIIWTARADGALDHISPSASSNRLPIESRLGDSWLETIHPDDRDAVAARWHTSIGSGEPYETQFRVRMADGTYRWQLVRAMPQHDVHGSVVRWVGVNIDINDQREAD